MEEAMKPMSPDKVARVILSDSIIRWRRLRIATDGHDLSCPCRDCGDRRKLGATMNMPYAGPVLETNTSLRKV